MDNSRYADTAQARASDKTEAQPITAIRQPLTAEQITANQEAQALRAEEELRKSRARVKNALSQLEAFFAPVPAAL